MNDYVVITATDFRPPNGQGQAAFERTFVDAGGRAVFIQIHADMGAHLSHTLLTARANALDAEVQERQACMERLAATLARINHELRMAQKMVDDGGSPLAHRLAWERSELARPIN